MRSGAARGHLGYFHETALYGSDREFLEIVVPFVEEGRTAGEPVVVACGESNSRLLRAALPSVADVVFLSGEDRYRRPATTIRLHREMLSRLVADGAEQVRCVGEVPHPGTGAGWDSWARYEAAANRAFADFPLWGLCPYDTRLAHPRVLEDVARTHPFLATTEGRHLPNHRFQDPAGFLAGRRLGGPDPGGERPPDLELVDPGLAEAREAVRTLAADVLSPPDLEAAVMAVSETVGNALVHGVLPVVLRAWLDDGRALVSVHDRGGGPADPFVGLMRAPGSERHGGFGLWLVHQMCDDVGYRWDGSGFTVRFSVGALPPA